MDKEAVGMERDKDWHHMMAAFNLCPADMSAPDRMRWIAAEFRRRAGGAQQPAASIDPKRCWCTTCQAVTDHAWRMNDDTCADLCCDVCHSIAVTAHGLDKQPAAQAARVAEGEIARLSEELAGMLPSKRIHALRALLSRAAPSVPEGWRPVPVEPTLAMKTAMANAFEARKPDGTVAHELNRAKKAHAAMLAAAPQPSAQQADPCPGCIPGGVCKTPTCGRLKAQQAEQPAEYPCMACADCVEGSPHMCPYKRSTQVFVAGEQPAEEARGVSYIARLNNGSTAWLEFSRERWGKLDSAWERRIAAPVEEARGVAFDESLERAAFEAKFAGCNLEAATNGEYLNPYVEHQWEGWRQRALLAAPAAGAAQDGPGSEYLTAYEQECQDMAAEGIKFWKAKYEALLAGQAATGAQEPFGYMCVASWGDLVSEMIVKVTRHPQPKYGFTKPIFTAPQAATGAQGLARGGDHD